MCAPSLSTYFTVCILSLINIALIRRLWDCAGWERGWGRGGALNVFLRWGGGVKDGRVALFLFLSYPFSAHSSPSSAVLAPSTLEKGYDNDKDEGPLPPWCDGCFVFLCVVLSPSTLPPSHFLLPTPVSSSFPSPSIHCHPHGLLLSSLSYSFPFTRLLASSLLLFLHPPRLFPLLYPSTHLLLPFLHFLFLLLPSVPLTPIRPILLPFSSFIPPPSCLFPPPSSPPPSLHTHKQTAIRQLVTLSFITVL